MPWDLSVIVINITGSHVRVNVAILVDINVPISRVAIAILQADVDCTGVNRKFHLDGANLIRILSCVYPYHHCGTRRPFCRVWRVKPGIGS